MTTCRRRWRSRFTDPHKRARKRSKACWRTRTPPRWTVDATRHSPPCWPTRGARQPSTRRQVAPQTLESSFYRTRAVIISYDSLLSVWTVVVIVPTCDEPACYVICNLGVISLRVAVGMFRRINNCYSIYVLFIHSRCIRSNHANTQITSNWHVVTHQRKWRWFYRALSFTVNVCHRVRNVFDVNQHCISACRIWICDTCILKCTLCRNYRVFAMKAVKFAAISEM